MAQRYQEARASLAALDEILSLPPQPKPKNPQKVQKMKDVQFEGVSFHYSTNQIPSVDQVNIEIPAGKTVAFAGASGSCLQAMRMLLTARLVYATTALSG